VTLAAGTYAVTFRAAQRNFGGAQTFQVKVDGNLVGTFTTAGIAYADYVTATFTVAAGAHTVTFEGLSANGGDNTALLDDVRVRLAQPLTLSRSHVNEAGQVVRSDAYFHLTGLAYSTAAGLGAEGTNFHRTQQDYDKRGRPNRTVSPTGTIYRTVYDGLGRAVSEWVGTDDEPTTGFWSPTNTADTNLVQTSVYEYDGGDIGDSNLTKMTESPGSAADRVTEYAYDWRNRLVATKAGAETTAESLDLNRPVTYSEYDNLGQVIARERYDGDQVDITAGAEADGVPDRPDPKLLRARTTYAYDERGRLFRTRTFGVTYTLAPPSATVSEHSLTTDTWYDRRGNVVKVAAPGGLVQKSQYDGAGRMTVSSTTDGGGDRATGAAGSWDDAGSVVRDTVLEQVEYRYDADGNVIQTTTKQRFHDATAAGALAGPSDPPARFVGTDTGAQGTWQGVFGQDGYSIAQGAASLPAYAQVSLAGQAGFTWGPPCPTPRRCRSRGSRRPTGWRPAGTATAASPST
jgi:YD repeat-containing protein